MTGQLKGIVSHLLLAFLFVDGVSDDVSLGCLLLLQSSGRDEVQTEENTHLECHSQPAYVGFLIKVLEVPQDVLSDVLYGGGQLFQYFDASCLDVLSVTPK